MEARSPPDPLNAIAPTSTVPRKTGAMLGGAEEAKEVVEKLKEVFKRRI